MTSAAPGKLSVWQKLAYAGGQAGNVLTYQLIGTFILPLYTPPAGQGFHNLVPAFVFGLVMFLPRAIDTFFDPYIANRSDRSTHRLGRRRVFMLIGCLPLALFTGAIFFPPLQRESLWNAVFLFTTLTAYFCLFSTYVAPYLALLPELFPHKDENTQVSTLQAGMALGGAMLVSVVAPLFLPEHDPDRSALKLMAGVLAAGAFVLLALPVLFIDERKLVARKEGEAASHLGPLASLKQTMADKAFLSYVMGSTLFFVGFTVVQTAAPNFVEVLLQKPLKDLSLVLGPLFGVAGLFFFAVSPLQKRFGKRRLMIAGAVLLAALMGLGIPLLPSTPSLALPLFAGAGVSIAVFLALPNAMLADICAANAKRTGQRREGMFFGAQGFLQKVSLGAAVTSVSIVAETFGKSIDNPLGVQLSGPLAALFLLGSAFFFFRYPEQQVQAEAAS